MTDDQCDETWIHVHNQNLTQLLYGSSKSAHKVHAYNLSSLDFIYEVNLMAHGTRYFCIGQARLNLAVKSESIEFLSHE